jgi:signal transduction histidine kinase
MATARATEPSRLLSLNPGDFEGLLAHCPLAAHTILRTMAQRMQLTESVMRGQEKLAALGKLAAGLAHELNNPAAAAHRAAGQLREALGDLLPGGEPAPATAAPLDPLARSDQEEAIADWLAERGVDDSWDLAPSLVEAGLDVPNLAGLAAGTPRETLSPTLRHLAAARTVRSLLDLLEGSTGRISTLVEAIKSYSYMDQAPLQEIDVHDGLESTLIILRHLLNAIEVVRHYDPDLPRISAYGSELNQVWTNLLDNAIDALGGTGRITIRTAREGERVLVEIADNGPGIPPEIQPRIFEPFFTTKGVGEGTGLGLDICYRIVVGQHGGEIAVSSQPGETRFTVRLPIQHADTMTPSDRRGGPAPSSA